MPLNSYLNKGILRNNLKRFGWIGVSYFIGLFLFVPFRIIMLQYAYPQVQVVPYSAYNYVAVFNPNHSPVLLLFLVGMPVLAGTLLFRYLHTGEEVAFNHALPVNRKVFYHTHMLTGLILLLVPLLLTFFISWMLSGIYGLEFISSVFLIRWLFISAVLNLVVLSTCVLMGVITGMSFLQVLLTFILLVLPSGIIAILNHNLGYLLYGWPAEYYSHGLDRYSPLLKLIAFYGSSAYEYVAKSPLSIKIDYHVIALCLVIAAVFYFLGLYLYNMRKLERAGEAITFDLLREIFRYGVVFCFMLAAGSYFGETQGSRGWIYIGYFIGSILSYIGVEILLSRSLDIFRLRVWKGYMAYALVVVALLGILNNDLTGYEKRIPSFDEIKYVYMDETFGYFQSNREFEELLERGADIKELESQGLTRPVVTVFHEGENIKNILRLQKDIIADRRSGKETAGKRLWPKYRQVCLVYATKDGRLFCRQYNIEWKKYASELKPIYESEEYKKAHFGIYRLKVAEVREMSIISYDASDKKVVIKDPSLIAQAIEALKKDVSAMTYEEMFKPGRASWGSVDFLRKSENPGTIGGYQTESVSWEKSFVYFDEWLKKIGKYEKARVIAGEDVKYVLVKKIEDKDPQQFVQKMERQNLEVDELIQEKGFKKIEDVKIIEYCLKNCLSLYGVNEEPDYLKGYTVIFVYKNKDGESPGFPYIITSLPAGV